MLDINAQITMEAAYMQINIDTASSNNYNVTANVPLSAGIYYTSTSAREAVPVANRKLGLSITYSTDNGIWENEQFIGSDVSEWEQSNNWITDIKRSEIQNDVYTAQIGVQESTSGYYNQSTGVFASAAGWTSKKFDISEMGVDLYANCIVSNSVAYIGVYWNSANVYVGYESIPVPSGETTITRHKLVIPANAKYFGLINHAATSGVLEIKTTPLNFVLKTDYDANKVNTDVLINSKKNNDVIYTSPVPINLSYSVATNVSTYLSDSQEHPAGKIQRIKVNANARGILKLALLRKLDPSPKFKAIKYIDITVVAGYNDISLNEVIDETFHIGLMTKSAQILTAGGNVGAAATLYYSGAFLETTTFSSSVGRSINIEIEVNTSYRPISTGKSICFCGDSITDFCDSVNTNNNIQYIGYYQALVRRLKFTDITNMGYSGIKLGQSGGWVDTKISLLPFSDIYVLYIGTNDFALAPQTAVGTIDDYLNNTGINTFYGALRLYIDGVYAKNSSAKIYLITPTHRNYASLNSWSSLNSNNNLFIDFVNAIKSVGITDGIRVIDLFENSGINRNTLSIYTVDNLHPNTYGYDKESNIIYEVMASDYVD